MHLFLIRHGQSETNANWQNITTSAQMNAHLTDHGRQESQKAADWLANHIGQIDALYTSSLYRAVQTAAYFEDRFGVTAVIDHRIREGGYSYDDARPIEDDLLPIRKVVNCAPSLTPASPGSPRASNFTTICGPAPAVPHDVVHNHLQQRVVVITHGWTINALMDVIYNAALSRSVYLHLYNTSITYVEYIRHEQSSRSAEWEPWRLYFVGATPHLNAFPGGWTRRNRRTEMTGITILGLGPGDPGQLTLEAWRTLEFTSETLPAHPPAPDGRRAAGQSAGPQLRPLLRRRTRFPDCLSPYHS